MTSVNLTIYQLFMILFWYIVVSKSTFSSIAVVLHDASGRMLHESKKKKTWINFLWFVQMNLAGYFHSSRNFGLINPEKTTLQLLTNATGSENNKNICLQRLVMNTDAMVDHTGNQ